MTSKKPKLKVLYQRLGDTWYAFADIGGEMFIGKVPLRATASEAQAKAEALKQAEADASRRSKNLSSTV